MALWYLNLEVGGNKVFQAGHKALVHRTDHQSAEDILEINISHNRSNRIFRASNPLSIGEFSPVRDVD